MNPAILRICDVNCNRAREAFRVIEDYARFALNHSGLCESLKTLRHDFQRATAMIQQQSLPYRDTSRDVGTHITTETEQKRESISSVVIAACKRLGEALRTIEEYTKIPTLSVEGIATAGQIETLRYCFYEIEKTILLTLTPGRERMRDVRLYVLLTESLCKQPWQDVARQVIDGGADCIQLREKNLDSGALIKRAEEFVKICRDRGVISIINDRADIGYLSGADGVHLGQTDLPPALARKIVGTDSIVGVSTHRIEQARQALTEGADYIGVGPIFPSQTKPKSQLAGLPYAEAICKELSIKAIAISGINRQNLPQLLQTGITAVAVSSSVIASDNPRQAAFELKQMLE